MLIICATDIPPAQLGNTVRMESTSSPPRDARAMRLLAAAKVLLASLLIAGSVYPHGPFEGKGMLYRLPVFLAPGLIVSWRWWRGRGDGRRYPIALDAALTLPFLSDTLGNAFGLFDHLDQFDSVMHLINWVMLCAGITLTWGRGRFGEGAGPGLLLMAGSGFGAVASIGWEAIEYGIMRSGVGGLHLTYADTIKDLLVSTSGGALGAWWAVRRSRPAGRQVVTADVMASR